MVEDVVKYGRKNLHPLRTTWSSMKQRCYNPKNSNYKNYGARGITVCDRWRDSFHNFTQDMGCKPTPRHTLDRVDNGGEYSKDNCRWSTPTEQCNNTRRNVHVTHEGITKTVTEWAEHLGMNEATLYARIVRRGWTVHKALTTPTKQKPREHYIEYKGEKLRIFEWADRLGMNVKTLDNRIRLGWDVEKTLTTPVRKY